MVWGDLIPFNKLDYGARRMTFYNETGLAGVALAGMTNITGSLFLSLLLFVLFCMMIAWALKVPVEFTALLVMPLLIVLMAYEGQFLAVGGVILIYLGILAGKNFFFFGR